LGCGRSKVVQFRQGGRQADEIEADAPEPDFGRSGRSRRQPFALEAGEHEAINRAARPRGRADEGRRRSSWGLEGPVFLIRGALGDPLAQRRDLSRREALVRLRRRHSFLRIIRLDALHDLAFVRLSGNDRRVALAITNRARTLVEPQSRFTFRGILPVALETVFREDGPDVAIELELGGRARRDQRRRNNPAPCTANVTPNPVRRRDRASDKTRCFERGPHAHFSPENDRTAR
jgi:hypothetical protein